jgi:hypothetical protein
MKGTIYEQQFRQWQALGEISVTLPNYSTLAKAIALSVGCAQELNILRSIFGCSDRRRT